MEQTLRFSAVPHHYDCSVSEFFSQRGQRSRSSHVFLAPPRLPCLASSLTQSQEADQKAIKTKKSLLQLSSSPSPSSSSSSSSPKLKLKLSRKAVSPLERKQQVWVKLMEEMRTSGDAVATLKEHRKQKGLPRAELVGTLCRLKQMKKWRYVTEILEWLKGESWWEFVMSDYDLLLLAYGKLGEPEKSEKILKTMQESGVEATVVSYTCLIEAYGKKGLHSKCGEIFEKLLTNGPAPTTVTYQTVINAYIKGEMYEDAERVFATILEENGKVRPDQRLYNLMIHCCAKTGKAEQASYLFRRMKATSVPISTVTYNSLMSCQTNIRDAENIFNQMMRTNVNPDVFSYTCLIDAYSKAKRAEEAEIVFNEMVSAGIRPNQAAYNALLSGFAFANLIEGAESVLKRMKKDRVSPDLHSYNAMLNAYANGSQVEQAEKLLKQMRLEGIKPDVISYCTLMKGYLAKEDLEGLMKIYNAMLSQGVKPNGHVFTILIEAHGKKASIDQAISWFEEMVTVGVQPDGKVRSALIDLCTTREEKEKVLQLLGTS